MSIIKLNNRSVKDITQFGSISSLGSLTHIATQTASSSSSISFTSGIDSTYKEYIFYFVNIHPQTNAKEFGFNLSIDAGSNYNVQKTTTTFDAYNAEASGDQGLRYDGNNNDLANGTGFMYFNYDAGNEDDSNLNGYMHLFNPSSNTFVKHFTASVNWQYLNTYSIQAHIAGYGNTTSPIDAVKFQMESGYIDSGQILLFGLN